MLFFGVFLRESARTAAKSRTNLSTNSGKATKWLGRLTPNLAHMSKFIWEWIYAKQIAPRDTRWALGVFRGSIIQKPWEAVRLTPTLVHVCGFIWEWTYAKYKSTRVLQIQKSGEAVKRLDRLAPNLAHICRSTWEWIYAKQIALRDMGGTWGF